MVAGAHDIKIPWPGHEDSVQKRGVAEMWQVLNINIITFSYILLACVISKILLSFFGEMWTKKSINLSFINYFVAEEFDSVILVPLLNYCPIHICFCICSTKGLIRQSSQTTSPSSNWTNPLNSMSEQHLAFCSYPKICFNKS